MWLRQKCLSVLCKICGRQALLPGSLQLPRCGHRSDGPLYGGGSADVWEGKHQGTKVAVKVLRVVVGDLDKIRSVGHCPRPSKSVNGGVHYEFVEVLQGSHHVEKSSPPKRSSVAGSDHDQQALRNGIGVDG